MSWARLPVTPPSSCAPTRTRRPWPNTAPFTTPGGIDVTSILLTPLPITQDNLDVVIDAGWTDTANVCQGVEAGSVAVCP